MLNLFFIGILCWISITDIYEKRIPDSAIMAAIGFRILFFLFQEGLQWKGLIALLLNGLAISLPLLFLVLLTEKLFHKYLFGGGDIKLLFVTGMYLGWERNLWALLVACFLGCFVGLLQIYKNKTEDEYFPFGPFIAISALFLMHFF